MSFLDISEDAARGTVTFSVRVQPRASRDAIAGVLDGALKIRLTAPPLEGRANDALVDFLSSILKTPKSAVRIRSGEQSRNKRVEIFGVTRHHIEALLQTEA
ncbi:MAG TPA: DUF167 domain-containing protein [Methylomirabilota bacterium]|nr:DUF167 domain-containing protein [Methylomirabilota bacterium]